MILNHERYRSRSRRIGYRATLSLAAVCAVCIACSGERIVSLNSAQTDRTVNATVGDVLALTLQTVGPGEFGSPPMISSAAITFLDVADVGPSVPAGPTQQFRFRATAFGTATITFTNISSGHTVQDTVVVR